MFVHVTIINYYVIEVSVCMEGLLTKVLCTIAGRSGRQLMQS